jgi:hypothetical protein
MGIYAIIIAIQALLQKWLARREVPMIHQQLLKDAVLVNVCMLHAPNFMAESWPCIATSTVNNCFNKHGFYFTHYTLLFEHGVLKTK